MDVFNLVAKIALDTKDYEGKLSDAKGKMASFAEHLKGGLATAAKIGAAAVTAASGAVAALTKASIDQYADYEQLVGGVETLFGSSAQKVIEDAQEAFKTAGMSMNDYMETSIQSAAALINSLGGDQAQAAELMNMSITDMADNVNKMGTSMEAVQNAYRGFSRGNFMMLDNLALGFAGTKQGMEELLARAKELSGVDYNIESYADIVQAIHVVQTEMGITGTTAKEASETISGSIASMKSAWSNLVTGIADENADFEKLTSDFVESVATVGKNLLPRIQQVLQGVGQLVQGLAPVIAEALPPMISEVLPSLVQSAIVLVQALVTSIVDNAGQLIDAAIEIILVLANGLIENIDVLIQAIAQLILTIVDKLTQPETLKQLVEAAVKLVVAIAKGLLEAIPYLLEAAGELVFNILYSIGEWEDKLFEKGKEIVQQVANGIKAAISQAASWGRDLIDNFVQGIKDRIQKVIDTVKDVAQKIKNFLGFSEPDDGPLANFHTYAPDMMELFAKGIDDNKYLIPKAFDSALNLGMPSGGSGRLSGAGSGQQAIEITLNMTNELDGAILARKTYKYYVGEKQRKGAVEQLAF